MNYNIGFSVTLIRRRGVPESVDDGIASTTARHDHRKPRQTAGRPGGEPGRRAEGCGGRAGGCGVDAVSQYALDARVYAV